jgi:signal transduction histidine kinase
MAHQHIASDYMEHGYCFSWETGLVTTHVAADIATGLAYFTIAAAMFYFAFKRRDLPFLKVYLLFAAFILACGTTHFFAAYTVFVPDYWPEGYVKVLTAAISVLSAVVFIPLIPQALTMPSLARTLAENQDLNSQLNKRVEDLQDKTAELERFIYTISHDLKSPLITISGFVGMLRQDFDAADSEGFDATVLRISTASERMKQLLDELLELSRIGRKMNPPERVQMNELVREAIEVVHGRISGAKTLIEVEPDMPYVKVDRQRLLQAYENLIDNAVKFSAGSASPSVKVGVRRDHESSVFYVQDNGIGIDARYLSKVFDLFEKLDPRSSGTGVGLAITKRVIEIHGGRIWAESAGAGQGTTFCFTLPDTNGGETS